MNKAKHILNNKDGAAMIVLVAALTVILVCSCMAIDIGSGYCEKSKAQGAVDATVYSIASDLPASSTTKASVDNKIFTYLKKNGIKTNKADVKIDWTTSGNSYPAVRVTVTEDVKFLFGRAVGINDGKVKATAKAVAGTASASNYSLPLYIDKAYFEAHVNEFKDRAGYFHWNFNTNTSDASIMGDGSNSDTLDITGKNHDDYGLLAGDKYKYTQSGEVYAQIKNNTSLEARAGKAGKNRMQLCRERCGGGCTKDHHSPNCPRVCTIIIGTKINNNQIKIDYYVPVFIENVASGGNGNNAHATWVCALLEDYKESGVPISTDIAPNIYTSKGVTVIE